MIFAYLKYFSKRILHNDPDDDITEIRFGDYNGKLLYNQTISCVFDRYSKKLLSLAFIQMQKIYYKQIGFSQLSNKINIIIIFLSMPINKLKQIINKSQINYSFIFFRRFNSSRLILLFFFELYSKKEPTRYFFIINSIFQKQFLQILKCKVILYFSQFSNVYLPFLLKSILIACSSTFSQQVRIILDSQIEFRLQQYLFPHIRFNIFGKICFYLVKSIEQFDFFLFFYSFVFLDSSIFIYNIFRTFQLVKYIFSYQYNIRYLDNKIQDSMSFSSNKKRKDSSSFIIEESIKKFNQPKQQYIKKLLYLFTHYSSKSSRFTYQDMQQKYFIELFENVWQIAKQSFRDKHNNNYKSLLSLFYSRGKKSLLNFTQFLDLLPSISLYFHQEDSLDQSMKILIKHLLLLYQRQVQIRQTGKTINLNSNIQQQTKIFISKLNSDLVKIYKVYFWHQLSNTIPKQSFKFILDFLQQFQILPKLISCRDIFFIFNETKTQTEKHFVEDRQKKIIFKDYGKYFTYDMFIYTLVILSKLCFPKLKQVQNEEDIEYYSQKQQLQLFLEYMETIRNMKKEKLKCQHIRFSLIVYDDYPQIQMMKTLKFSEKTIVEPVEKMKFFNVFDRLNL